MAKVLKTIIVNCKVRLSACGRLIARDWTGFTFTLLQFVYRNNCNNFACKDLKLINVKCCGGETFQQRPNTILDQHDVTRN